MPVGIDFRESQPISQQIVIHLMDGLKFLHQLGIVHQDIHPSNLILDYCGGYISWPIQLLKGNESKYIPTAEDDLLASILIVSNLRLYSHIENCTSLDVHLFLGASRLCPQNHYHSEGGRFQIKL